MRRMLILPPLLLGLAVALLLPVPGITAQDATPAAGPVTLPITPDPSAATDNAQKGFATRRFVSWHRPVLT